MAQAAAVFILGAGASATAVALTTAAIQIGVGLAVSAALAPDIPGAPKPEDVIQNFQSAASARQVHMGRVKVGGAMLMPPRPVNGKLHILLAQNNGEIDGREQFFIDGNEITLDSDGFVGDSRYIIGQEPSGVIGGIFDGVFPSNTGPMVQIITTDGSADQAAIPELSAAFPDWTANHRARGIALALIIAESPGAEEFSKMFPDRTPGLSTAGRMHKPLDPRTQTRVWSENPIAYLYDYLRSQDGMGFSESQLDTDDFIAAANDCDDQVLTSTGSDNRYRIGGTYLLDAAHRQVVDQILAVCDGQLFQKSDERYGVRVGKEVAPTVTLEARHLVGVLEWAVGPSGIDGYTTVKGQYTDQALGYVTESMPPWTDSALVQRYGREIIGPNADYASVPTQSQARRLAKIRTKKDNPVIRGKLRYNLDAMKAIGEQFVNIDIAFDDFGASYSGPALIEAVEINGGGIGQDDSLSYVDVTILIVETDLYSWTAEEEIANPEAPVIDPDTGVPVPTGLAGVGADQSIDATWNAAPTISLAPRLEYTPAGLDQWVGIAVSSGATSATITGLTNGDFYDIRLSWVTTNGAVSDPAEVLNIQPPVVIVPALNAPGNLTITQI